MFFYILNYKIINLYFIIYINYKYLINIFLLYIWFIAFKLSNYNIKNMFIFYLYYKIKVLYKNIRFKKL